MAASDVLLLTQRVDVADMALPSKLTSYFSAGRPVVAAVAEGSEAQAEVEASRGGVVVAPSSPEELLGALTELASNPLKRAELGRKGQEYARMELSPVSALSNFEAFMLRLASLKHHPT